MEMLAMSIVFHLNRPEYSGGVTISVSRASLPLKWVRISFAGSAFLHFTEFFFLYLHCFSPEQKKVDKCPLFLTWTDRARNSTTWTQNSAGSLACTFTAKTQNLPGSKADLISWASEQFNAGPTWYYHPLLFGGLTVNKNIWICRGKKSFVN